MSQKEALQEMVATMLLLTPDQLGPETSMSALDTSLGGARLKLGLKRLGLQLPAGSSPTTFGELEAALSGNPPEKPSTDSGSGEAAVTFAPANPALSGVQVGIDVQDVRALPAAEDYWEHEFYAGIFAKQEIAYAVVQSEPRVHLAGFWCAKEALRKCDPSFMKASFVSTFVAHESDRRPYMLLQTPSGAVRLPHNLSLSHTSELATAVVAYATPPAQPPSADSTPPPPAPLPAAAISTLPQEPGKRLGLRAVVTSVGLLSIGAVIALLVRHFWLP